MTPPTEINGTRRRAECPVCGRILIVRVDGLLRLHHGFRWSTDGQPRRDRCEGSYVDCTGEGTAT